MEDDGPTASITFLILLLINLCIYGFSTAMEYVNEKEVQKRAEEDGDKNSIRLQKCLDGAKEYKNMMRLALLFLHVFMGYFCVDRWTPGVQRWFSDTFESVFRKLSSESSQAICTVLVFIILLYAVMIFGILVPRKLAKTWPDKWAYAGIAILWPIYILLKPIIWIIRRSAYIILILFGINPDMEEGDVTEEEIIDMVNEGQEQGIIEAAEAEMISNIFEYKEKEAQDIMTNRNHIIALDGELLLKDAIDAVLNGKVSRYPVYEENIDHIIGILHLKDAMRYHADHDKLHTPLRKLTDLLREPEFIPQTRNIDELFKEMQSKKLQMVIVIDEYGQTSGLIAMEDILEEIVGNIMDEYDEETEYIEEKGNDEYIIEGKTPLEELEERFDISFGDVEFETLNGFLISKMDKIPEENEQFEVEVEGYHFKILSVENKMIHSVLVTRKDIETKVEEK